MVPSVVGVDTGTSVTTANPTVSLTTTPVTDDVLILFTFCGDSAAAHPTAVSGCGATWTRIAGANTYMSGFWMGVGATSTGTITVTAAAATGSRVVRVHHLRGVTADAIYQEKHASYRHRGTSNQIVLGFGTSQGAAGTGLTAWTPPQSAWTTQTEITMGSRRVNTTYHFPHFISDCTLEAGLAAGTLVVGCPIQDATVTRRNLIPNSSSDTKDTFSTINASNNISAVTDPKMFGARSTKMTASAAAPICYRLYFIDAQGPRVRVGQTYTASAYANSVNARNGRAIIRWKDYSGALLSTSVGTTTALPANTWTRLDLTGATAPTSAVFAEPGVEITDGVSTDVTYLDGWLLEEGSTLGSYFDGYTVTADRINLFMGGPPPSTSQTPDEYHSIQTTVPPAPTPSVVGVNNGTSVITANPTVTLSSTPLAGDVLIVSDARGNTGNAEATAVSGCGATWSKIGGGHNYMSFWIGVGATSTGTITATATASTQGRALRVHHLRGVTKDVYVQQYKNDYPVVATPNQIVLAACYSQSSTLPPITSTLPANQWTDDTETVFVSSSRRYNTSTSVPKFPWTFNATTPAYCLMMVIGSPVAGTKIARRNLAGNSSFETSATSDWQTIGATGPTRTTATSAVGSASATGNYSASATPTLRKGTGSNGPQGPVVPGRTYTVSCYVRCNNARNAGVVPMWLDLGQSIVATVAYSMTMLVPNTWTRVSWTGVAPASAKWVGPESKLEGCLAGDVYWWDGFLIEEGTSTVGDYFDGWTAAPPGDDLENFHVGAFDSLQSVQVVPTASQVWERVGAAWVDRSGAVMKAWNGTTWLTKRPKYWNGTAWTNL